MGLPNGVHHLAIGTRDIKAQIEFFTQVVGMELVALYWMHGVPETVHGFLRLNDSSSLAFVQMPDRRRLCNRRDPRSPAPREVGPVPERRAQIARLFATARSSPCIACRYTGASRQTPTRWAV